VPLLGAIPFLGELFRTRNTQKTKTNFLIFLQPHILRNDSQASVETDAKYDYIRDQQRILNKDPRALPLQPYAPADPLPSMQNGRTSSGILSPDADAGRHGRSPVPPSTDAPATTSVDTPVAPYAGSGTPPNSATPPAAGTPQ